MNAQTNQLQEQARAAYKRKDYTKALELFSRAIGRSPSLQLHDNRAACHERLEDFPAALKDAKKAIQLAKEDPTGYVRAGRVLVKMERKSVALEIYAHGLKSVKHVGQGYELLRKVHRELMTELSPPKSVDPLTVLPRELAEQILDYLNFKQVMNTSLVSKEWSQFIRRTPNLWRHLDLTLARRKVKNTFVSRVINIGRSKLKIATLRNIYDFDKALAALARHCPLEELSLHDTGMHLNNVVDLLKPLKNLRSLTIGSGTILKYSGISAILENAAATLETVHIDSSSNDSGGYGKMQFPAVEFPNMHDLEVVWKTSGSNSGLALQTVLKNMPHLRRLKLHDMDPVLDHTTARLSLDLSELKHLSRLDLLWHFQLAKGLLLPTSLKSFAIGTWRPNHSSFFRGIAPHESPLWSLPLLEELRICAAEVEFDSFEHALQSAMSPTDGLPSLLHTLSMTASDLSGSLTKEALSHPRLKELKHLSLERCYGANDDHISLVGACFPKLQSLDVSGTDVTGAGLKGLVNNGLKKLIANDCRLIGPDAIQWARGQGVRVEHRSADAMTGGKKVRY